MDVARLLGAASAPAHRPTAGTGRGVLLAPHPDNGLLPGCGPWGAPDASRFTRKESRHERTTGPCGVSRRDYRAGPARRHGPLSAHVRPRALAPPRAAA